MVAESSPTYYELIQGQVYNLRIRLQSDGEKGQTLQGDVCQAGEGN